MGNVGFGGHFEFFQDQTGHFDYILEEKHKMNENVGFRDLRTYRVSKNVLYRVSEKYLKYQINNEPNHNTCNRMFDMCSSYRKNFIYISLSIAI